MGFHKRHTGRPTMSWAESVCEALCFGWIDGKTRRIDDDAFCIRFTPRRPGSNWSALNVRHVEELMSAGRMQPAGYRQTAIFWVVSAKREETRDRRLATLIEDSAHGRRIALLRAPERQKPPGGRSSR